MPHDLKGAREIMAAAFGKESILDLHLEGSDKQIYDKVSGLGRYVYLPYAPARAQGDGISQTPYQKSLGKLHRLINTYNNRLAGKDGGPMSLDERDEYFTKMEAAVSQLKKDIRTTLTGKKGLVANMTRAHIEDSGIFTAYGNQLYGNEESRFFKKSEFRIQRRQCDQSSRAGSNRREGFEQGTRFRLYHPQQESRS